MQYEVYGILYEVIQVQSMYNEQNILKNRVTCLITKRCTKALRSDSDITIFSSNVCMRW